MLNPPPILSLLPLVLIHLTHGNGEKHIHPKRSSPFDSIPYETRVYWMRRANSALAELDSPCPFAAFATVVVNHTDTASNPKGKLVCIGINQNFQSGNPTLHGEISAISNCSSILTDQDGSYKLLPAQALKAFSQLSLYTNAESCPMCAAAIRWSGFAEYIYGTSIDTLFDKGWRQISISSEKVFEESTKLPGRIVLIADVLANETDPHFSWQFDHSFPCPTGCWRPSSGMYCMAVVKSAADHEL